MSNENNQNIPNENNLKTPSLNKIFGYRDKTFTNEYPKLFKLTYSTTCEVKTNILYHTGRLTLSGNILTVLAYDKSDYIKSKLPPEKVGKKNTPKNTLTTPTIGKINQLFPLLYLDFNLITAKIIRNKTKKKFRIYVFGQDINNGKILNKNRIIKFRMLKSSQNNFLEIINLISKSIILSKGNLSNLIGVSLRKYATEEYFITNSDFQREANTCDVLLFKGLEAHSKLQRKFTLADYDHVALLVKKNKTLFVYESQSKDGVKLRPWREFTTYYWNLLYEKMVFRKLLLDNLIITNKEQFYEELNKNIDDFIKDTQGKQYSLKEIQLCCHGKMKEHQRDNKWSKQHGFFCSQLVAAAYHKCGLISDDINAGHYLPGTFSRYSSMKLEKGCSLSPEYIIDFTE